VLQQRTLEPVPSLRGHSGRATIHMDRDGAPRRLLLRRAHAHALLQGSLPTRASTAPRHGRQLDLLQDHLRRHPRRRLHVRAILCGPGGLRLLPVLLKHPPYRIPHVGGLLNGPLRLPVPSHWVYAPGSLGAATQAPLHSFLGPPVQPLFEFPLAGSSRGLLSRRPSQSCECQILVVIVAVFQSCCNYQSILYRFQALAIGLAIVDPAILV